MTSLFLSPATWVIFGAAAQLSLLAFVRAKDRRVALLPPLAIAACLLAAIPTARDEGSPFAYQIGLGFGLLFSSTMIASASPAALNGGIVLAVTTTYWSSFIAATGREWWGAFAVVPACLAALPATLVILGLSFGAARPPRWLRFLLHVWTLAAMVVVGVVRFPYGDFAALGAKGLGWVSILSAAYLGAHIALLAHNLLSLALLLPFAGENQTFAQRWKEVEKYASSLIDSYSDAPVPPAKALAIIALQAAFVAALSRWRPQGAWIAAHASLSICLVASTFFARPSPRGGGLPTGGDIQREKRRLREKT